MGALVGLVRGRFGGVNEREGFRCWIEDWIDG